MVESHTFHTHSNERVDITSYDTAQTLVILDRVYEYQHT